MRIRRTLKVPTGHICIADGEGGSVEFLSIGDYGKEVNLKCDALGLTRVPDRVIHREMLPLSEKWVVTISTQHGCSMGCRFCDVPKVGPGRNVSHDDLVWQVRLAMSLHPEVRSTKRFNLHYARMGEPTWNPAVLTCNKYWRDVFKGGGDKVIFHPVISTMMPKRNPALERFLQIWMAYKNGPADGEAGLQLSINSTDDRERDYMFNGSALALHEVAQMVSCFKPKGRKITLNFALAGYTIDAALLAHLFNPEHFIVKLTPMHKTARAELNSIKTEGDYTTYTPYEEIERKLKAVGFDVLVFIASEAEDLGRITCGNAILSGTLPICPYDEEVTATPIMQSISSDPRFRRSSDSSVYLTDVDDSSSTMGGLFGDADDDDEVGFSGGGGDFGGGGADSSFGGD